MSKNNPASTAAQSITENAKLFHESSQTGSGMVKTELDSLHDWQNQGVPVKYAAFHKATPPGLDKEPVNEFYILGTTKRSALKYTVDSMIYTPHGLIFKAHGETSIIPLANINYVRFL